MLHASRPLYAYCVPADLAQLVEQLSCKQQVIGSSPIVGSTQGLIPNLALRLELPGIGNACLWLDLQTTYELAQARTKENLSLEALVVL